jgi:dTDP-4-amino-4,6-dideoxygalactose transaminase
MMKPIQMVDLRTQYEGIKSEVDQAIQSILLENNYINGEPVKRFASNLAQYLGASVVIPCGNGTDALQIALMALDLKPGDEVITSPFTFIATAEVIALLGLVPVFADIHLYTFNINVDLVKSKITKKTKVIIPVHLFGQCADMEPLLQLAQENNIAIIEDNAQAIGSQYHFNDGTISMAGTMGQIGCTSFYPSKNLGAYGDGGAISTNNPAIADTISMICNHGSKVRYYHDVVGVNSRLDSIQAAVLDIKLKRLDEYINRRRAAADQYDAGLQGLSEVITPFRSSSSKHVFHQYTLRVLTQRDALQAYLSEKGIPSMIYYPVPLHLQPAYAQYGYKMGDFPESERAMAEVLSLPMHTELEEDQLHYISDTIRTFFN